MQILSMSMISVTVTQSHKSHEINMQKLQKGKSSNTDCILLEIPIYLDVKYEITKNISFMQKEK